MVYSVQTDARRCSAGAIDDRAVCAPKRRAVIMMFTRMTRTWVASSCAAIALAMSASVATATIAADSALWEFGWEGDVLPQNATPAWSNNWSGVGLGDFTLMSDQYSDSFARFDDSAYASGIEWEGSGVALDPKTNDGAAFEMRVRMPEKLVTSNLGALFTFGI